MGRDALLAQVKTFRRKAEALLGGPIDAIWVFGSQAAGTARPDSDTDLLVVSASFEALPFLERCARIRRAWPVDQSVDMVCLTPQEFEERRAKPTLVHEAVENGIACP